LQGNSEFVIEIVSVLSFEIIRMRVAVCVVFIIYVQESPVKFAR